MNSTVQRRNSFSLSGVNPFSHTIELTWLRLAQVVLMSLTLVPFRLAAIVACLLVGYVLALIALFGLNDEEIAKAPLVGWRRKMVLAVSFSLRAAFFCAGFHRVRTRGTQASPVDAPILCAAPHTSFFDIVLACITTVPSAVTKAENVRTPILGHYFRATQPVVVSRSDKSSRGAVIVEMKRRVASRCWPQIIIFPEGTTTNGKCLISFKPGAFLVGVPVQPVLLKYKNSWDTRSWTWEGSGGLQVFWYTLCQWQTDLEVEFLPVYIPSDAERSDAQLFADNVQHTMAHALGVTATDHSFEDCCLMQHAAMLNLPIGAAIVEFQKIRKKLNLDLDHLKDLLVKFCEVASFSNHGRVGIDEFAAYMDLPVSDTLKQLFALYDRDGRGYIDFREYVIGMSLLTKPANGEDTIKLAFNLFDNGNKGYIVAEELAELLFDTIGVPHSTSAALFEKVDEDRDGRISYDEFKSYAAKKPEYALLFQTYQHQRKTASYAKADVASAAAATAKGAADKAKAD